MTVNRRAFGASIALAIVVSIAGGYALSRSDSRGGPGNGASPPVDVLLDNPGVEQIPAIRPNAEVEGDALAIVDVVDNDGATVSTADLLGQPLIINYWYSTCVPCKRELPAFAAVHAELGDRIRFVGMNPFDTPETNESFARERGVHYELLRDPDGAFTDAVGIANAPVTLFVATDGTIVRQTAELNEAQLLEYATELLA